jgi:hydroxymethylbilane synthase
MSCLQQHESQPLDVCMRFCQQRERWRNGRYVRVKRVLQRMCGNKLCNLWPLMNEILKIGTRGSPLALWQATWVQSAIESLHPSLSVEILVIKTKGDKILDVPLAKVGGKGLFVKEIEEALLEGRIDLAVHSMKDMPAALPPGLCIGAIPVRERPHDVLISRKEAFHELRKDAVIGTSSLRRAAQLQHVRSDLSIRSLRGNLDTRLRKLDSGDMDAIVLAAAGVLRLGLQDRITEYLDERVMLPAAGQGALCIEIREDDKRTEAVVGGLDDPDTRCTVSAERAFLHRLGGSCQVPIAAYGILERDTVRLTGLIADVDGSSLIRDSMTGPRRSSEEVGTRLADRLMERGAADILERLRLNGP